MSHLPMPPERSGDGRRVGAATLLAVVARALLEASGERTVRVGDLELRPHQLDALQRVRAQLARHGGTLLADEVGLGKTLVALALLCEARSPVVVAPAGLRPMWTQALARAGLAAPLVSFESLSRGRAIATRPDLLVVDEAHHARTPSTRRYDAIAALAAGARTLLLSATPVHNRARDLAALLALFLGSGAYLLDEEGLARHVVRHTRADVGDRCGELPKVEPPRWLSLPDEGDVLEWIAALPPPVPPADGGEAGALATFVLVRQWASSRGALRGALRRRLAQAGALADAIEAGRVPTRAELSAWSHHDGVVQLAFAELMSPPSARAPALLDAIRAHAAGVRALLDRLARLPDPDLARADAIRRVRARHPGARIVAFSEHAETVAAYFALLRRDPGIAMLTAQGGRVAGGRCTRADVLRRFAPCALGVAPPAAAERVELLLTTDLLSEGVNLQDASVVVHLDLPWSPARLEQRVGRVRRIGAAHASVHVYLMPPPAPAERLLATERRLRRKLAIAGRAVGIAGAVLPSLVPPTSLVAAAPTGDDSGRGEAEEATRVRALLAPHRAASVPAWADGAGPLTARCAAEVEGCIALVADAGGRWLIARLAAGPLTDRAAVVRRALEALRLEEGDAPPDPAECADVARALESVRGWLARRTVASLSGLVASSTARSRRRVLDRLGAIGGGIARHRRAVLAPLLAEARRTALAPLGVGAERMLDALAASALEDEPWLRAVATFGRLHAPGGSLAREPEDAARIVALLVLVPSGRRRGGASV